MRRKPMKHRPIKQGFERRQMRSPTAMYYWVVGKDSGKRVIMGGYRSYSEAERDGFSNFQEYEIIPLPTYDRGAAREMIRKKVLDETHSVDETFKRFRWPKQDSETGE